MKGQVKSPEVYLRDSVRTSPIIVVISTARNRLGAEQDVEFSVPIGDNSSNENRDMSRPSENIGHENRDKGHPEEISSSSIEAASQIETKSNSRGGRFVKYFQLIAGR